MATSEGFCPLYFFCRTLIDRCHGEWCLFCVVLCLGSFPFWNFDSIVVADLIKKVSLWVRKHIFSGVRMEGKQHYYAISLWFGMMIIVPMIGSISRKSVSGCEVEHRLYPVMLSLRHRIWTYDNVSERQRVRMQNTLAGNMFLLCFFLWHAWKVYWQSAVIYVPPSSNLFENITSHNFQSYWVD